MDAATLGKDHSDAKIGAKRSVCALKKFEMERRRFDFARKSRPSLIQRRLNSVSQSVGFACKAAGVSVGGRRQRDIWARNENGISEICAQRANERLDREHGGQAAPQKLRERVKPGFVNIIRGLAVEDVRVDRGWHGVKSAFKGNGGDLKVASICLWRPFKGHGKELYQKNRRGKRKRGSGNIGRATAALRT